MSHALRSSPQNRDKATVVPLDIQAWALLSFRDEGKPFIKFLEYAEQHMRNGEGYDFSKIPKISPDGSIDEEDNGIWYEGTAHMALAYRLAGHLTDDPQAAEVKADKLLAYLKGEQNDDGSIPACNRRLWTGFMLPDGSDKWYYFNRKHIGATAWLIFAETGNNPFWLGEK
jgi:hypothetical protein